jgi:hypothetical protein
MSIANRQFLCQKSFHPANQTNRRKVEEAKEQQKKDEQYEKERQAQLEKERQRAQDRKLYGGKDLDRSFELSFMYNQPDAGSSKPKTEPQPTHSTNSNNSEKPKDSVPVKADLVSGIGPNASYHDGLRMKEHIRKDVFDDMSNLLQEDPDDYKERIQREEELERKNTAKKEKDAAPSKDDPEQEFLNSLSKKEKKKLLKHLEHKQAKKKKA